ncbi:hypothetical protein [Saccharothrix lopnurensis]|uniref:AAA ATPase-like protein n=1 Tax=Saccharothrix lopnurensis TaxID=1670621 RepID=A0ABW1NY54_9PSEU
MRTLFDLARELDALRARAARGTRPTTSAPGSPRPRQLPPDVPAFTGRTGALTDLDVLLDGAAGRARVAVVSAIAGVGKTALALRVAAEPARSRPDRRLADLVEELSAEQHRPDLLDAGGDALVAAL